MEWSTLLAPLVQLALILGVLALLLIAAYNREAARNMILFLRDLQNLVRKLPSRSSDQKHAGYRPDLMVQVITGKKKSRKPTTDPPAAETLPQILAHTCPPHESTNLSARTPESSKECSINGRT